MEWKKTMLALAIYVVLLVVTAGSIVPLVWGIQVDEEGNYDMQFPSQQIIAPKAVGDIVTSFPTPGSSPSGLAWDGEYLWHADYGAHRIYKLDPSDGSVVASFSSLIDSGLTWDGEYLWASDADTDEICKLDPSDCSVIQSFSSPGTGPLGLAWDGEYLWNADWETNKVYQLDPSDCSVIKSFNSPDTRPYGLTWDGENLWIATRDAAKIWKLDPSDGSVIMSFSSPGPNPEGLTWDGRYLWNADRITDMIYQIDVGYVPDEPTVSISTDSFEYSSGDTMTVTIDIANPTSNPVTFEWYIGVPQLDTWVTYASAPIPAGFDNSYTIPIPVGNWGPTPFGLVHYVHMLDSVSGDVLVQDVALCAYSAGVGEAMPVDIEEEIMKTIERVELPS